MDRSIGKELAGWLSPGVSHLLIKANVLSLGKEKLLQVEFLTLELSDRKSFYLIP